MKFFWYLALACIFTLLVWIDLPENYPINLSLGKVAINTTLNPLSLNTRISGKVIKKDFVTKYGLDLKGGSHLVFEADASKLLEQDIHDAVESSKDIIEKRVNFFGVSEPFVQTVKSGSSYRIIVDLPGVESTDDAVKLIGKTANLNFREALNLEGTSLATIAGTRIFFNPDSKLSGGEIKKATVTFDSNNGKPQVALSFTNKGTQLFADLTAKNLKKPIGIFVDDTILSAPTVQTAILDGNAVITGDFSLEDAKQLAVSINSGALPVPIKLIEQRTIGPTLGAVEIQKSVTAGVIGLTAVALFMILYYGRLGVLACVGLIIYGLISFALFRTFSVVLTLSGVAGFILSIGMAVDANILIFERIKEEKRKGRDHATAVRLGFGRAIDAIKDANITTLLVAFILYNPLNWELFPQLGLVKGFALTLTIGVLVSLFTGVVITKRLLQLFYKK